MLGLNSQQMTLLSSGNQSQIYSYGQPGHSLVLKVVPSSAKKQLVHLKNQFLTLQSLHHPNVVTALKLRENVTLQRNQQDKQPATQSILVLEHAQKGSFLNYLLKGKPDLSQKRTALKQIIQATHYLHSQGIAHRDLKLQNILVFEQGEELTFKLADFGFASRFKQKTGDLTFRDYKGTKRGYMAPQIHEVRKDVEKRYDAVKTDIFALGVILFTTVFGKFPFEYAQDSDRLYKMVKEQNFQLFWEQHKASSFDEESGYRMDLFKPLFLRMVSYQPEQRPEIFEVLSNGWFAK